MRSHKMWERLSALLRNRVLGMSEEHQVDWKEIAKVMKAYRDFLSEAEVGEQKAHIGMIKTNSSKLLSLMLRCNLQIYSELVF